MCIFLLPSVGEGVPKGRMRGGFPLTIPSPAGGRGPGRGWARFTSPPPGERPGAGGIFFSSNLCPLYACHTVPLFSQRSRPMNGTVSRTRHGPPDLANATVSALEPTATKRTSALLRRSLKSDPDTKRKTPTIAGGGGRRGSWLNHRMGKNGDRSSFGGYKDDCSPCRPTEGTRAPVKRGPLICLPPERQADGPTRVEAPR